MQHAIDSRETKIERYPSRLQSNDVPDDIVAELCRFGAISVCGHLERCVQIIILERLSPRAHHRVVNFVKSDLKRGRNFKCPDIVGFFGRFETSRAKKLESYLKENDQVVSAVESLYSIRNPLAHGASSSIGVTSLKSYFSSVRELTKAMVLATR